MAGYSLWGRRESDSVTQQQHMPIGHFLNCLGFVFVGLFSSLPLSFSCGLMTIFSAVLGILFSFCSNQLFNLKCFFGDMVMHTSMHLKLDKI